MAIHSILSVVIKWTLFKVGRGGSTMAETSKFCQKKIEAFFTLKKLLVFLENYANLMKLPHFGYKSIVKMLGSKAVSD